MSYRARKLRVAEAEQRLGEHLSSAVKQTRELRSSVRQSVTPGRIVVTGLLGGLLIGWTRPGRSIATLPALLRHAALVPSLWVSIEPWFGMLRDASKVTSSTDAAP